MFGGERRKATCFAANTSAIQALAVTCDESHPHKPWLVTEHGFDTALEAEYPRELCTALAAAMLSHRFQASDITRPTAVVAASAQRQACRAVPSIVPTGADPDLVSGPYNAIRRQAVPHRLRSPDCTVWDVCASVWVKAPSDISPQPTRGVRIRFGDS